MKELIPRAICKSTKSPPEGETLGLNGIEFHNQKDQGYISDEVSEITCNSLNCIVEKKKLCHVYSICALADVICNLNFTHDRHFSLKKL